MKLPNSIESEKLVLGTIMTDRDAYSEVSELLNPECFYEPLHQDIYKSIQKISSEGDRPDIVTVYNYLKDVDIIKLTDITQYHTFDIYQHACIIYDKSIRRKFFEIGNKLIDNSYSEETDIADVIKNTEDELINLFQIPENNIKKIDSIIKDVFDQINKNYQGKGKLTGTPTGFEKFDDKSGGLQKSDLIIIAGETSQGKTSFALSAILNAAIYGAKVAYYSLEMKNIQLAARLMSMQSGIPSNEILYTKLRDESFNNLDNSISKLTSSDIYFDDASTSNIDTIISSIRTMKIKYGIEGAVVDYLQILNVNMKGFNKEQQMADVARRLKNLAKELNIWIIALSQLNRDSINPRPTLNRLRDSGQIAEAADVVMFVYRPEVYSKQYPEPYQDKSTYGTAMIDVAKGRNIGLLKFLCKFDAPTTHFYDEVINNYINPTSPTNPAYIPF
jgi:replicative DNA helicase